MLDRIRAYYENKLSLHGVTAKGVDWNSAESQGRRFESLLTLLDRTRPFSINDYGCGYGALVQHLAESGLDFSYHGYDISSEMLGRGRELHAGRPGVRFSGDPAELRPADYTVASGLFNVKLSAHEDEWTAYVLDTIADLAALSRRGFAFNLLTAYSDPERKRGDLYYADPSYFFQHCKESYSRWVALLHDYGLYEFTIVVREDDRQSWQRAHGRAGARKRR